ncbi:DNA polymerase III subunit epsilon [Boudabousia tangfeifanii]|uniref:DNA polymerase III subunit epsilon n=1 Tax=Boudabousia tangfeifanii TaxID=1912795 RepID=A0A1D9MMZ5_9ACTO|nr:DNA polymerase III subunit epsilon [Boudabousia tangfeifanii]
MCTGRSRANPGTTYKKPKSRYHYIPSDTELLMPDFVAVDFETANKMGGVSACQIALVKVKGGQIVDRFSSLIKPPVGWDRFEFTYLHGIRARDVKNAPSWLELVPFVDSFIEDLPAYAHNAQFDSKVWRELDEYYSTKTHPQNFYCSYLTAKRIIPDLENYKLPTVLKECAPSFRLNHHKADSDAEACAIIVTELQRRL